MREEVLTLVSPPDASPATGGEEDVLLSTIMIQCLETVEDEADSRW